MRIEQLYHFIDLTKTLSITKTANNFYISQQALSESFKKLENEFSIKLFQRTRHGVILTPEGIDFINTANDMINLYEKALNKKSEPDFNPEIPIKIAVHPRLSSLLIPDVIKNFSIKHPNANISFIEADNDHIFSLLANNNVDFGLIATVKQVYLSKPISFRNSLNMLEEIDFDLLFESDNVFCTIKNISSFEFHNNVQELPLICYEQSLDITNLYNSELSFQTHKSTLLFSYIPNVHKKLILNGSANEIISRYEYEKYYKSISNINAYPISNTTSCFCIAYNSNRKLSFEAQNLFDFIKNSSFFK